MTQDARQTLEEFGLINGGDCFSHFHSEDRRPTQDFLRSLQQVAKDVSISANYSVRNDDNVVLCNTTTGNITVTLPRSRRGVEYTFIKTAASNTLTIDGSGAETINGSATLVMSSVWSSRTLKSIGNGWVVINGYL